MKTSTARRGDRRTEPEVLSSDTGEIRLLDAPLIAAAKQGDRDAYAELWQRHRQAVTALTYPLAYADTEDTVSEAFTTVWDQLQRGQGPAEHFRAYLVAVSRNIAARRYRVAQRTVTGTVIEGPPLAGSDDLSEQGENNREIIAAFAALPERWQQILWWQEVEDRSRTEIASRLSLSPNSVSALMRRAREGLRLEWLRQQLPARVAAGHGETVESLPKYVRGALSTTQKHTVHAHLIDCGECTRLERSLQRENHRLGRKIAAGGALALALGGTLSADLWAAPTAASAAALTAAPAHATGWLSGGGPIAELCARGARTVTRGARRATQTVAGGGAGVVTAGVVVSVAAAAAIAVGATSLFPAGAPSELSAASPRTDERTAGDGAAAPGHDDTSSARDARAEPSARGDVVPSVELDGTGSPDLTGDQSTRPQPSPASPTVPDDTTEPEPPVSPEQPEVPTTPELPEQPEKPVQPEQPEKPGKPEQPEKPVKPEQPAVTALTVQRSDAATGVVAPTLTGRATPGSTVRVDVAGQRLDALTSDTGQWSIDLAASVLPVGDHVARISQVVAGAEVGAADFAFTLAQPTGRFALGSPEGETEEHTRFVLRAEFTGTPGAQVCFWSSRSAGVQRLTLDSQGAGAAVVPLSTWTFSIDFSYCDSDRLGVRGNAPLTFD
ncbi:RNA polymerase sigma factor (sigma-70 family) [Leucobacter luti]|uniref:RNA polymerase sigma factor (Sigma-70 family) n=1 Tax=Leucobacter luti TaxID=340320 RepID=A0A4Q7U1B3_9MICO|nr:RNA polymerase sigma factor (sigma-70 family) [Leucobacter luti]